VLDDFESIIDFFADLLSEFGRGSVNW